MKWAAFTLFMACVLLSVCRAKQKTEAILPSSAVERPTTAGALYISIIIRVAGICHKTDSRNLFLSCCLLSRSAEPLDQGRIIGCEFVEIYVCADLLTKEP